MPNQPNTTVLLRRRIDRDKDHILRIEKAAAKTELASKRAEKIAKDLQFLSDKNIMKEIKAASIVIKQAASNINLAQEHEIILKGPNGILKKVCDLDDTVNGNSVKKITGVVPDLNTLKIETEKDLKFVKRAGTVTAGVFLTILGAPLLWLLGHHPDLLADFFNSKSGVK
jgi:hypothetical protein